jgi:hypothetical protein
MVENANPSIKFTRAIHTQDKYDKALNLTDNEDLCVAWGNSKIKYHGKNY